MSHLHSTTNHLTPITTSTLAIEVHQQASAKIHAGLGINSDSLSAFLRKGQLCKGEPDIYAHRFDKDHFIALTELAYSLGMEKEVSQVFSSKKLTNLRPFLNSLTGKIQASVEQQTTSLTNSYVDELIELVVENESNINRSLLTNYLRYFLDQSMGCLSVGINDTNNSNFDHNGKISLSLESEEPSLYNLLDLNCPIAKGVAKELKLLGHHALLVSSSDGLFYYHPDFYNVYEEAEAFLQNGNYKDAEDLLNLLIDDGNAEMLYWFDDDEEALRDNLLPVIETLIDVYNSEFMPTQESYLSKWFKSKVIPLDSNYGDNVSHDHPRHLVTDNAEFANSLSAMQDEQEDCESRIILNVATAIDTCVAINMNRNLWLMFDALCFVGNENRMCIYARNDLHLNKPTTGAQIFNKGTN